MRTDAADGGCGGGLEFAPTLVVSRVSSMFGSFSQWTVLDGNKFSADCVHSSSANMFRNRIDNCLVRAGFTLSDVDSR